MGFPTSFGMGLHLSQKQKWLNGYLTVFFPVMELSTDTKTGYDDLEVYMEYGYVFVSSTGRNHVQMAFHLFSLSQIPFFTKCCDWSCYINMIFHPFQYLPRYEFKHVFVPSACDVSLQLCHMTIKAFQIMGNSAVFFSTAYQGYRQIKRQNSTLLVLCGGNLSVIGGFHAQRASNADNVCHEVIMWQ